MIDDLDRTLERLLREKTPLPAPTYAVSFDVPTDTWAKAVDKATANVYLHDIRENHDLRLGEWRDELQPDGTFTRRRPVVRLDCFYVVTTWSSTKAGDVQEEHRLLALVLQTLLRYPSLPPEVLEGALVGQEPPLPYLTAQLEGLPQPPAEFWSALGNKLRPAVNLVVTIALQPRAATDVPERLLPVSSETLAVGVAAGPVAEARLIPPLGAVRAPGDVVRAVTLAASASGALAADVFASADELTVADGGPLAANGWIVLEDALSSEFARIGPKPPDGTATVPLAAPLRHEHAAGIPVLPADFGFTVPSALAKLANPGDTAIDVTDGRNLVNGAWVLFDEGPQTEAVPLAGPGTPGPCTVQLAWALQFQHAAGRTVPAATVKAGTTLHDPANRVEQVLALGGPPAPPLPGGTVVRIGRGPSAEFAEVASVNAADVTLMSPLRRNHPAGSAVRAVTDDAGVGRLARPAAPGDAAVGIAGDNVATLRRGDVVKLEGAATSYHEVSSVRVTLGAIHLPADVFERIGGRVIDTDVPPAPVTGASVRVVERNLVGETDETGRFMFGDLEPGTYHLSVSAPGFDPAQVPVQVPATKFNEYEVALTPH